MPNYSIIPDAANVNVNSQDDILAAFQAGQNKSEVAEVLRELFDKDKIYMITDMTKDELKIAIRIYMIAEIKGFEHWKKALYYYCMMLIARDRKSRREIIDALKGYTNPMSLGQRMNPMNWGRK
jgi:hypothetical protein